MDDKGSEREDLLKTLSQLEIERDYYRQVAERLGQKALADAQDFSQMIRDLRKREIELHQSQEKLEQTIEERTVELVTRNQELSEITLRYDNLVNRIPHGVYILRVRDTGAMQFEYLSPPICQILDIDPEEVKSNPSLAFSIAHPDDREKLESATRDATKRCIPFRWEGRFIIRQDVRWIRLEADPTTTPTGDIVWNGVLSDITERRIIQEKLKESEARLNFLVKNSLDSLVLINADGRQRYVSPAAERITGYPVSQLEGKIIDTLIHPDDLKDVIAAWNEAVENPEKTVTVQYRHIHKTQGWVYSEAIAQSFLAEPAINGVIASVRDITEHKRLERFLKDIITKNPMSMQILDKDGCTLEVNHSYKLLFGSIPPASYSIFRDHQLLQIGMGEFFDQLRNGAIVHFPNTYFNAYNSVPEFPDVPAWIRTIGFSLNDNNEKPERFVLMHENITERKRAEEATLNSNKLLQTIINTAPVRIFFKDRKLRYIGCNNVFAKDAGVEHSDEIIGKDDFQLAWKEQAELYQADDFSVIESGISKLAYDEPQTTPEGKQIWLRTSKVPLRDESNEIIGVLGMYEDITEHKKAEAGKTRLLLRQRAILDNLPMMAWLKDTESRLEMINEPYAKACGHTIDECIGKTDLDLFPEEMAKSYLADDHDVCVSGQKKHVEEMIASPDGIKWHHTYKTPIYDENGLIIGTAGIAQDITERKHAEEKLSYSKSLVNAALESTADGILIIGLDGKIARWNQKFVDIFHVPAELLDVTVDDPVLSFVTAQMASPEDFLARVMELNAHPEESSEDTLHLANGRVIERYSQPLKIREKIIGRFWSFRDITERNQAAEERERLQEQLIQAQKIESVGQLAGGVAHEFNNMLGVILGHAEMALEQIGPAEPLYGDLEQIRSAARRSADITRQLLAFARKQNIAPKVLDLNETIEKQIKMLWRLIGENIDLIWQPVSDLWTIKADPSQIDQILTNLCINARDAISGVGRIIVKTGNCFLDDNYCEIHAGCVSGEYVLISVNDTGCGIDEQTLDHIFEPFFTTKDVGQGTGLGLAMVYGAVKQNKGFLDVASELGKGTVFTIYLPRYLETGTMGQETGGGVVTPAEGGRENILLVEDDPSVLQMTTSMLQRLGYSVLTASTPGEAIRLTESPDMKIHLLITDVIMPEMNGRDLAELLLTVNNGIKCLFMSGYTSDIIDNQGLLVEGMHFIQKPFSKNELASKIREMLD